MILNSQKGDFIKLNYNDQVPAGYTKIQGLGDPLTGIAVRDDLVEKIKCLNYGKNVRYSGIIEIQ